MKTATNFLCGIIAGFGIWVVIPKWYRKLKREFNNVVNSTNSITETSNETKEQVYEIDNINAGRDTNSSRSEIDTIRLSTLLDANKYRTSSKEDSDMVNSKNINYITIDESNNKNPSEDSDTD